MEAVRNHLARNGQLAPPRPCVLFEFPCDPGKLSWILENAPASHGSPRGIGWARKSENCGGGSHKVPGPFVIREKKLNQHS